MRQDHESPEFEPPPGGHGMPTVNPPWAGIKDAPPACQRPASVIATLPFRYQALVSILESDSAAGSDVICAYV